MSYMPQDDVKKIKSLSKNYVWVGHGLPRTNYTIEGTSYSFGNPLSATMFSYLSKQGIAEENCKAAILAFEDRLYGRKVQLNDMDKVVEKMKGNVLGKIPYYKYLEKLSTAMSAIGAYVDESRIKLKQRNPYTPDAAKMISITEGWTRDRKSVV